MKPSTISVPGVFAKVEPFRDNILRMLLPSEISSLLVALRGSVTPWEESTHMDIMHEIFEDFQDLVTMQSMGLAIRIFGTDLEALQKKIQAPPFATSEVERDRLFYVFVIISDQSDGISKLHKDFRSNFHRHNIAEDMNVSELSETFPKDVVENIAMLSKWMLCTPHLTGTLPGKVPGWIPMFKTRKHIVLRSYISSYNEYKTRVLYMERTLMQRVFGYQHDKDLLAYVHSLSTVCYLLQNDTRDKQTMNGRLTMSTIRDVYMSPHGSSQYGYVIVNAIQPLDAAVILNLP